MMLAALPWSRATTPLNHVACSPCAGCFTESPVGLFLVPAIQSREESIHMPGVMWFC
jgi:hypothetical protein